MIPSPDTGVSGDMGNLRLHPRHDTSGPGITLQETVLVGMAHSHDKGT